MIPSGHLTSSCATRRPARSDAGAEKSSTGRDAAECVERAACRELSRAESGQQISVALFCAARLVCRLPTLRRIFCRQVRHTHTHTQSATIQRPTQIRRLFCEFDAKLCANFEANICICFVSKRAKCSPNANLPPPPPPVRANLQPIVMLIWFLGQPLDWEALRQKLVRTTRRPPVKSAPRRLTQRARRRFAARVRKSKSISRSIRSEEGAGAKNVTRSAAARAKRRSFAATGCFAGKSQAPQLATHFEASLGAVATHRRCTLLTFSRAANDN